MRQIKTPALSTPDPGRSGSVASDPSDHLVDGKYSIKDLVDIEQLRELFEGFSAATGFTTGFVSYPGQEILIATGWRDLCTQFHRACPLSAEFCKESNHYLTDCLRNLQELSIKPCGNGLVDGATPVVIKGKHIASLATGQVLLTPPDFAEFRERAEKYGYDTEAYLAALQKVPVVSESQIKRALSFLSSLAGLIAEKGLQNLQIRESEQRFRALFDSASQFVGLLSPDGILVEANQTALNAGGLLAEDVLNRPFWETPWWTTSKETQEKLQDAIGRAAAGEFIRYDTESRGVGDQVLTIDFSLKPVFDEQGEVIAIIPEGRDITQHKKLESQLFQAQRLESIGRLASGVAHDINNILSPILMAASALQDTRLSSDEEKMIETIQTCARRGSDIIKQVLTFARGGEGARRALQLNHLLDEIVYIILETFPKSIVIESKIPHGLHPIAGDATQLHQVLLNLCLNARDAMPEGGKLTLAAENIVLDPSPSLENAMRGPCVELKITDTGIGIPPEIMDKIFDPFFTTKAAGSGTGLGLSTVAGIVKSHNGIVSVESQVGKGSTFCVILPASIQPQRGPGDSASLPAPDGKGELILLVDDEVQIRTTLEAVLKKRNYRVVSASDGAEALAVYLEQGREIGLVFTDIIMPSVGGIPLIRALKTINPKLKVIASTGQADAASLAELAALDVNALLPKPFDEQQLLGLLHKTLQG